MRKPYSMKVYRYMSFERFCEILFKQELTFVNPNLWPDQYETYVARLLHSEDRLSLLKTLLLKYNNSDEYAESLAELIDACICNTYCFCFSRKKDSEVLWNTYSYNNTALMIRTSVNKIEALSPDEITASRIHYDLTDSTESFLKLFRNVKFDKGGGTLTIDTNLFSHKRKYFHYEDEMRFIAVTDDELVFEKQKNFCRYPISNVSDFIEGVLVHPLASDSYVDLIKSVCKHFNISFWGRSKIYEFRN